MSLSNLFVDNNYDLFCDQLTAEQINTDILNATQINTDILNVDTLDATNLSCNTLKFKDGAGSNGVLVKSQTGALNTATYLMPVNKTDNSEFVLDSAIQTISNKIGYLYTGTLFIQGAGGQTNITLNSKAGVVRFVGQSVPANDSTLLTITNNMAGTIGLVSLSTSAILVGAIVGQSTTLWTQGAKIEIAIFNYSATSTSGSNFELSFISFD